MIYRKDYTFDEFLCTGMPHPPAQPGHPNDLSLPFFGLKIRKRE